MGAAGWHICIDVLDHLLGGTRIGRIVRCRCYEVRRLAAVNTEQFGIKIPKWALPPVQKACSGKPPAWVLYSAIASPLFFVAFIDADRLADAFEPWLRRVASGQSSFRRVCAYSLTATEPTGAAVCIRDASQRATHEFDHEHTAIIDRDGALWSPEARSDFADLSHGFVLLLN
jgi:hypothetical protein